MKAQGKCLCGKSSYRIDGEPLWAGSCYCEDCQRESGGGHLTALAIPASGFEASGPLKIYSSRGGSGRTIDRSFCTECGSTLFSHPHALGEYRIVRAGTLDDSANIQPAMAVYCSQAQPWDQPPDGLEAFAKMPPSVMPPRG